MKVTTDACLFGAWVAQQLKDAGSKKVLDIGTGTGLLSLMIAQKNSSLDIHAIEIDKEAAGQAKENVANSPWKNAITIINTDIKEYNTGKYDCIVSNPPFYENELRSGDAKKNIAHHGGDLTLNSLFAVTKKQLTVEGNFLFLLPYKRKEEIEKLLAASSLFIHETVFVRQSTQHDRFRIMLAGGLTKAKEVKTNEISIWNDKQQYTLTFVDLLREYYLYL
jgi:tRNA1Val (adenine37-N6)-methyltransferase